MIIVAYVRPEKKAKKYVREKLIEIENTSLSVEEHKEDETFLKIIEDAKDEIEQIEEEKKAINKYDIIKQKLVTLFVSGLYTNTEMARILCVNPATVRHRLKDEEVLNMIQLYRDWETDRKSTV